MNKIALIFIKKNERKGKERPQDGIMNLFVNLINEIFYCASPDGYQQNTDA